ncbi:spore coat protein U-like protein [Massilia sp. MP_M2]|uniref:hypothetical protein n=1 Tax=Massilia sp. MP_M2 TaxID=3071713 RepID=UPI00319E5C35
MPTVGNADTLYGASFAGHGTVQYGFGSVPLSAACTANSTYQIALNCGVSGNLGARTMKNSVIGQTLTDRISATPDGPAWGDGLGGTMVYSGTGSA